MADVGVGKELVPELRRSLAPQLPGFLIKQRWFGGKARKISSAELIDVVPIRMQTSEALLLVITVKYVDNIEESYAMPVLRAANAVSYTHLDVYKRQPIYGRGIRRDFTVSLFYQSR